MSIPDPGSKFFTIRIQDPGEFYPKKWLLSYGNLSRVVHPGSGSRGQKSTGSRIQGSKRHRIPDPDPQQWIQGLKKMNDKQLGNDSEGARQRFWVRILLFSSAADKIPKKVLFLNFFIYYPVPTFYGTFTVLYISFHW
jgi:hypothetical protein